MVRASSPVRVAKISRTSWSNTAEEQEVDFNLARRAGVLIHSIEFAIGLLAQAEATTLDEESAHMSVHVETGELEVAIDAAVDAVEVNSEIIAECSIAAWTELTASAGGALHFGWLSPKRWVYKDIIGQPLLLASNPTVRHITSASGLTVSRSRVTIWYQHVDLTQAELANLFVVSR